MTFCIVFLINANQLTASDYAASLLRSFVYEIGRVGACIALIVLNMLFSQGKIVACKVLKKVSKFLYSFKYSEAHLL